MIYTRKLEPATVRGTCTVVGCGKQQTSAGNGRFKALCSQHRREANPNGVKRSGKTVYRQHKGKYCVRCGPEIKYAKCQLDVDHKDGDRNNHNPENLWTLCANCHRLKTHGSHLF